MRARFLLLLLVLLFWACTGSDEFQSDTGVPAVPTGALVLEHGAQSRELSPEMTHLVLRGLTRNGKVLVPSRSVPLGDQVRVELPETVERVQLDYYAADAKVGEFDDFVAIHAGQETHLDPSWVTFPKEPETFGADLEAQSNLMAQCPVGLPPNMIPGTAQFSPNPPTPPSSFTVPDLPPIGMQGTLEVLGSPGTCIAWSFGYGLGGYTASRNPDGSKKHDIGQLQFQPSPAFLFRFAIERLKLQDCSKSSDVYLPFMVFNGSATLADVKYVADCSYIKGLQIQPYEDRFNVRIGSYYLVNTSQALLRQFLANGQPVAFACKLPTDFKTPPFDANGVYNPSVYGDDGHGMLLVGYNDQTGSTQSPEGAFLIQNSFGTTWPPENTGSAAEQGQIYWGYDSWLDHVLQGTIAYPVQPTQPSGVTLTSSPLGATTSILAAATQVTQGSDCYLVLSHWFKEPVVLQSISVVTPSGVTLTQSVGDWSIQNGYTYFLRQDGNSFETGTYPVTLTVNDGRGTQYTLTGNVTVGSPPTGWPQLPPAVPGTVYGSNLQPL